MLFPRREWEAAGWTALFQDEGGLTPGDRIRNPWGGSEPAQCPVWVAGPASLPLLASLPPASLLALAMGAPGLSSPGSCLEAWCSGSPPATISCLHVLLIVPPRQLMNSHFLCPVHLPGGPVRCPRGCCDCASWVGYLPCLPAGLQGMRQDGGSHPGVVCLWRHFWLFQLGGGAAGSVHAEVTRL